MNLTTIERFKQYKGTTDNGSNQLLSFLIPFVSSQVQNYLGHRMEWSEYCSWESGSGASFLRLPQWPITELIQVRADSFVVAYLNNSSASEAYVTVTPVHVRLIGDYTQQGSLTSTSIVLSSCKTLSSLRQAVAAYGNGWEMTIVRSEHENTSTRLLRPLYGRSAVQQRSAALYSADDPIEVEQTDVDLIERRDGGVFPNGINNVFVEYSAGYILPGSVVGESTLPEGLELVVFQILSDVIGLRDKNAALQSESMGDYSYSLRQDEQGAVASAIFSRRKELDKYRRLSI
jgi:hypothetical protein